MTEEVKERSFSEIQAGDGRIVPENLYVIKRDVQGYNQYWSEEKHRFGPLLEATFYTEKPVDMLSNGILVDYKVEIGLKK